MVFFWSAYAIKAHHGKFTVYTVGRATRNAHQLVVVKLEYSELGEIARRHIQTGTVLHGNPFSPPTPSFPSLSLPLSLSEQLRTFLPDVDIL